MANGNVVDIVMNKPLNLVIGQKNPLTSFNKNAKNMQAYSNLATLLQEQSLPSAKYPDNQGGFDSAGN